MTSSQHVYEVRPRKDHRGVDLISDVPPFGSSGMTDQTLPARSGRAILFAGVGQGETGLCQKRQVGLVRPTPAPEIYSVKYWNLLPEPIAMSHQIVTYTELRKQIHNDLRIQHPEWVEPNGECSICDSYEARLIELLATFTRTGSDESVVDIHRVLEQGLNRFDGAEGLRAF